jgi:hypothetical protein
VEKGETSQSDGSGDRWCFRSASERSLYSCPGSRKTTMQKRWERCCDRGGRGRGEKRIVLVIRSGPDILPELGKATISDHPVTHATVQVTVGKGTVCLGGGWTWSGAFTSLRVKLPPRRLRPCTLGGAYRGLSGFIVPGIYWLCAVWRLLAVMNLDRHWGASCCGDKGHYGL